MRRRLLLSAAWLLFSPAFAGAGVMQFNELDDLIVQLIEGGSVTYVTEPLPLPVSLAEPVEEAPVAAVTPLPVPQVIVPEPASIVLAGIGGLVFLLRRLRRR